MGPQARDAYKDCDTLVEAATFKSVDSPRELKEGDSYLLIKKDRAV